MIKTIHGIVHGKTIELEEDHGLADGQEVEMQVRLITNTTPKAGHGLLRTEGALANDTEWDAIMEEIYQARKRDQRPQIPDMDDWLTP
jgi:hypothetical protein